MIAAKSSALWVEEYPEDTKFFQFLPSCQAIAVRPVFLDLSRNTVLAPVIGVGLIFFLLALFEEMECFETIYLRVD